MKIVAEGIFGLPIALIEPFRQVASSPGRFQLRIAQIRSAVATPSLIADLSNLSRTGEDNLRRVECSHFRLPVARVSARSEVFRRAVESASATAHLHKNNASRNLADKINQRLASHCSAVVDTGKIAAVPAYNDIQNRIVMDILLFRPRRIIIRDVLAQAANPKLSADAISDQRPMSRQMRPLASHKNQF